MKKYKQETVINYVYCNSVCDICGRDIVENNGLYGDFDNIKITHNHDEYSYGNGSVSYKKEYDICNKCFKKHIVLLFREEQTHE